jgi:hypothetical protein
VVALDKANLTNQRIRRACYLLSTFNPEGMMWGATKNGAALAKWSGESVETLIAAMREMAGTDVTRCGLVHDKLEEIAARLNGISL